MAFEQPLTNRAPPVLKLVQGAAITPIHHIYVDGVWLQVRVAAARAARAEAATGAPVLEVLEGDLITRYQFPLGYSTGGFTILLCAIQATFNWPTDCGLPRWDIKCGPNQAPSRKIPLCHPPVWRAGFRPTRKNAS